MRCEGHLHSYVKESANRAAPRNEQQELESAAPGPPSGQERDRRTEEIRAFGQEWRAPAEGGGSMSHLRTMASTSMSTAASVTREAGPVMSITSVLRNMALRCCSPSTHGAASRRLCCTTQVRVA